MASRKPLTRHSEDELGTRMTSQMHDDGYTAAFLDETRRITDSLDVSDINAVLDVLVRVKASGGRLFFAGSGGGAGHASHATADFRKIAGIESYSVTDNVAELTARINDDSWATSYSSWLTGSRIGPDDALFVFSVGGGDAARGISVNLVSAIDCATAQGASVVGVVGRDGGYLRQVATASVIIPPHDPAHITQQTEGFQALIWHLLVGHPALQGATPKWESVTGELTT